MNAAKVPTRNPRFFFEELPGENELMLVDKEQGDVRVLNVEAGGVWLLCDGERDESGLLSALREMLPGAGDDALQKQLTDALELLEREGLIER